MRDEFTANIKSLLARRVGMRCSNPECRRLTTGPAEAPEGTVNLGVAAHITAASPGGPRFDPSLSAADRTRIQNGIWLCQKCAKLIDNDPEQFVAGLLHRWKEEGERAARVEIHGIHQSVEPPPSILELIAIVVIRAETILGEMRQRNARAVETFRAGEWSRLQTKEALARSLLDLPESPPRVNAMHVRGISPEDKPEIEKYHPWFGIQTEKQLSIELDVFVCSFTRLHDLHVRALRSGQYVAAHEAVREIHELLDKYRTLSSPPRTIWPHPFDYSIDIEGSRADRMINEHTLYPGRLPRELGDRLPSSFSTEYLILRKDPDGDEWDQALQFAQKDMSRVFERLGEALKDLTSDSELTIPDKPPSGLKARLKRWLGAWK